MPDEHSHLNDDEQNRELEETAPEEEQAQETDSPFSFEVDIDEEAEQEASEPSPPARPTGADIPEIEATPPPTPRYWPDQLFATSRRDEEDVDPLMPPSLAGGPPPPAPAETPTPEPLSVPEPEEESTDAPEPPPSSAAEPEGGVESPSPPPAEASAPRASLPPATEPREEQLALPAARKVESDRDKGKGLPLPKQLAQLLAPVLAVIALPKRWLETRRVKRIEARRERELNKTAEQREKERQKREKRRAKRRKRQERRRRAEERRKRLRQKLRGDDKKSKKKKDKKPKKAKKRREKKPKVPLTTRLQKLPVVGPKIAAFIEEQQKKRAAKAEAKEDGKPTLSDKLAQRLRGIRHTFTRLLQRNVIGLDIGASKLRAVQIRDGVPVEIYEQELPDGIIVNGLLVEPEELVEELKRFWQLSGIRSKKVNFSLTNRLITLRTKRLSAKHASDIQQAVALNAEDLIAPMDPKESVIDYAEMSRSGPNSDLQITAADESMAKEFARAVEKAGLFSVSCEIGPLAATRALVIPRSPKRAHAVISVGSEVSWVAVGSGPDIFYLRIIDIGGNDFTKALVDELGITFTDAEELKKRCGIGAAPLDETVDPETFRRCRKAMRRVSDQLCQELGQTKRHWDEHNLNRQIRSWNLIGGGGRLAGLAEQISLFTNLPEAEKLTPFPGFESVPDLDLNAAAVGLAAGNTMSLLPDAGVRDTNVALPGVRRRSKISLSRSRRAGKKLVTTRKEKAVSTTKIAFLIAAALLGGSYYYKLDVDKKIEVVEQEKAEVDEANAANKALGVKPIRYPSSGPASHIAALVVGQPPGEALAVIDETARLASANDVAMRANSTMVTVGGTVASDGQLIAFTDALQESPWVISATLKERTQEEEGISFEVEVATNPGGAG